MKSNLKTLAIEFVLNLGGHASYTQIINYLLSLRSDLPSNLDISKDKKYRGYYSLCLSTPQSMKNIGGYWQRVGYFRKPTKADPRYLKKDSNGLYYVTSN